MSTQTLRLSARISSFYFYFFCAGAQLNVFVHAHASISFYFFFSDRPLSFYLCFVWPVTKRKRNVRNWMLLGQSRSEQSLTVGPEATRYALTTCAVSQLPDFCAFSLLTHDQWMVKELVVKKRKASAKRPEVWTIHFLLSFSFTGQTQI